jgi:O-antigen/teichoic acid export membrane protein
MIGRFLTVGDIGIYAAYYTASINVAGVFSGIFSLVYFPTISGYENKGPVLHKVNQIIPYLIVAGIPFIFICEYIVLKLYGAKYSLNVIWMLYFSIASICVVIDALYTYLLMAIGLRGARIDSGIAILMAVINAGFNFILIPRYGITGAIICLIFSYTVAISMKFWVTRDYMGKEMDQRSAGGSPSR